MTYSPAPDSIVQPASPLWAFSLHVYSRPDVAQACLGLQDDRGLDVNIVLLALYAGTSGLALHRTDFLALDAHVAQWRRESVWPLRAIRRNIKRMGSSSGIAPANLTNATYQAVKAAELAAEHAQQRMMEQWLSARAGSAAGSRCLRQNLDAYLQSMGVEPDATTLARCKIIEHAANTPAPTPGA